MSRPGEPAAATASVIIPVHASHNDGVHLGRCLRALERQSFERARIEVVLVGDGTSIRREMIPAGLRCVVERLDRRSGALAARNRGLERSSGDRAAFLDADAEPDPRWLELLMEGFDDPEIGACAGRTVGSIEPDVYRDRVESRRYVLPCSGAGNLAVRREVLVETGGFDERLCFGAEEADLCWRICLKGYRIRRVPEAVIRHVSLRDLSDFYWYGASARALARKYGRILRLSAIPELLRLAAYRGSGRQTPWETFWFRLAQPWAVGAGYLSRLIAEAGSVSARARVEELGELLSNSVPKRLGVASDGRPLAKPAQVIWWPVDGGCLIKDLSRGADYALEGVASRLWAGIMRGWDRRDLVESLGTEYPDRRESLPADFDEFVSQLVDAGLLAPG